MEGRAGVTMISGVLWISIDFWSSFGGVGGVRVVWVVDERKKIRSLEVGKRE